MLHKMLLLIFLLAFSSMQHAHAVTYIAKNNAGNTTYGRQVGFVYSLETLSTATDFIFRLFQQPTEADRKQVETLTLIVEDFDGVAFAVNNEIHVSAGYVENYTGDVKREITGVLYHEDTHIWQWDGEGKTPGGLIEGIADYVRLKSGFVPSHWVKPGGGDRWDQGYDVTARFLDYCNGLRNGFVAELNKKMRSGYSEEFFVEILGKNVDQLWIDYKAKYGST